MSWPTSRPLQRGAIAGSRAGMHAWSTAIFFLLLSVEASNSAHHSIEAAWRQATENALSHIDKMIKSAIPFLAPHRTPDTWRFVRATWRCVCLLCVLGLTASSCPMCSFNSLCERIQNRSVCRFKKNAQCARSERSRIQKRRGRHGARRRRGKRRHDETRRQPKKERHPQPTSTSTSTFSGVGFGLPPCGWVWEWVWVAFLWLGLPSWCVVWAFLPEMGGKLSFSRLAFFRRPRLSICTSRKAIFQTSLAHETVDCVDRGSRNTLCDTASPGPRVRKFTKSRNKKRVIPQTSGAGTRIHQVSSCPGQRARRPWDVLWVSVHGVVAAFVFIEFWQRRNGPPPLFFEGFAARFSAPNYTFQCPKGGIAKRARGNRAASPPQPLPWRQ